MCCFKAEETSGDNSIVSGLLVESFYGKRYQSSKRQHDMQTYLDGHMASFKVDTFLVFPFVSDSTTESKEDNLDPTLWAFLVRNGLEDELREEGFEHTFLMYCLMPQQVSLGNLRRLLSLGMDPNLLLSRGYGPAMGCTVRYMVVQARTIWRIPTLRVIFPKINLSCWSKLEPRYIIAIMPGSPRRFMPEGLTGGMYGVEHWKELVSTSMRYFKKKTTSGYRRVDGKSGC